MVVAENESVEPRLLSDQSCPIAHQCIEAPTEFAALDAFPVHQRDRIGLIGHPRNCKPKVRFAALLSKIERDETMADDVRYDHAERCIGQSGPDQVAGK